MALDPNEMGYFISQVGLAAASFGVTEADVTYVGQALNKLFNYRCSPPTTVVPEHGPQLQSMCTAEECPLAENATCALYENDGISAEPRNATKVDQSDGGAMNGSMDDNGTNSTFGSGSGSDSDSSSSTGTSMTPTSTTSMTDPGLPLVTGAAVGSFAASLSLAALAFGVALGLL